MKIFLAGDHAGFEMKGKILEFLRKKGYEIEDCGSYSFDPVDDYTTFVSKAAEKISENPDNKAIILAGSGQAEAITANKYKRVRAVVFYGPVVAQGTIDAKGTKPKDGFDIIRLTRIHNNANILSIGARFVSEEDAEKAIEIWLTTDFSEEERHKRRLDKILAIEQEQNGSH